MIGKVFKGRGEPLLYLDFDGVLHPDNVWWHPRRGTFLQDCPGHELFEHADTLAKLLEPHSSVKIVLSTSWVARYSFSRARSFLCQPLRDRVVGATFHSAMRYESFVGWPRGEQIRGDVIRRRPCAWFAIDDDHEGWPQECSHHGIKTSGSKGISEPNVLERIRRFLVEVERPGGELCALPTLFSHLVRTALNGGSRHLEGRSVAGHRSASMQMPPLLRAVRASLNDRLSDVAGRGTLQSGVLWAEFLIWFHGPQPVLGGMSPRTALCKVPQSEVIDMLEHQLSEWLAKSTNERTCPEG